MKKRLFDLFLLSLSKLFNKRVIYMSNTHQDNSLRTAVKSNYNFWYCGDIFDQSDIAYGVASNGTVEAYDTAVVISLLKELKEDYTFYDVGSNTGWYTMLSSKISDASRVYSFEPVAEHVECQKETIFLNRKEHQVHVFEVALSDHTGTETIRLAGSGTSLEKDFLEADFGTRSVHVETLDSVVQKNTCHSPDFIKIDVEGYEYKVLQGAMTTLTESQPILFIEIAKTLNRRHFIHKEYDLIFSSLASLGYEPYLVKDMTVTAFNISQDLDGAFMFLFLNKHKHSNIIEKIRKNLLVGI